MLMPYKNIENSQRKLYQELLLFAAFQIPISPDVIIPMRLLSDEFTNQPFPIAMVNRVLQIYTRRGENDKIYIIVPEMVLMTARIKNSFDIKTIIYEDIRIFQDGTGSIRPTDLENISASVFIYHILRLKKLVNKNTLSDHFQFLKYSLAKDILIANISDIIPQKLLPKIVVKAFGSGSVLPIDYEEIEAEKNDRKIAIVNCLNGNEKEKKIKS